jgi:predicted Fe-S protein YdhL (DUF1289 family)|tara:strand:- start:190 stop:474 length:285 start_codon:yes stop_codon:yes gene_type:complete
MIRDYRAIGTGKVKTEYICDGCTFRSHSASDVELVDVEYPDPMCPGLIPSRNAPFHAGTAYMKICIADHTLLLCYGCIALRAELTKRIKNKGYQ